MEKALPRNATMLHVEAIHTYLLQIQPPAVRLSATPKHAAAPYCIAAFLRGHTVAILHLPPARICTIGLLGLSVCFRRRMQYLGALFRLFEASACAQPHI